MKKPFSCKSLPRAARRPASMYAFTLIELMAVTGIIAILAAALFPALAGSREEENRARCISNLRQIMLASTMYANDYDGYVFLHCDSTGHNWVHRLMGTAGNIEYVSENYSILQCPSMADKPNIRAVYGIRQANSAYTWGGDLRSYHTNVSGAYYARILKVPHPDQLVLFGDSVRRSTGNQRERWNSFPGNNDCLHARHNHFVNVAFADGRVEAADNQRLAGLRYPVNYISSLDLQEVFTPSP